MGRCGRASPGGLELCYFDHIAGQGKESRSLSANKVWIATRFSALRGQSKPFIYGSTEHTPFNIGILIINQAAEDSEDVRQTDNTHSTPAVIDDPHAVGLGRLQLRESVSKCRFGVDVQDRVLVFSAFDAMRQPNLANQLKAGDPQP